MPKPKPKSLRRSVKVAGSVVAVLVLFEAALRLFGFAWQLASPVAAGRAASSIVVLGSSHTGGLRSETGYSYPDQLGTLLQAKLPGQAPVVVNAGEENLNTGEALEKLPRILEEQHPRILIVMLGEANLWNRHFLYRFLDEKPGFADFFLQLKAVQLVFPLFNGRFQGAFAPNRKGNSIFFFDTALAEYPTLALRWMGYLNANHSYSRLSPAAITEAEEALQRWLADPRSGAAAQATRTLAELQLYLGHEAEARNSVALYLSRDGRFNFRLYDALPDRKDWSKLRKKLASGMPPKKTLELYRKLATGSVSEANDEQLRQALKIDGGNPNLFGALAERYRRAGKILEAEDVFVKGLREDPFYAGGELPPYQFHAQFPPEEYRSLLVDALPPAAVSGEKPGLGAVRESFVEREELLSWAYHDLVELVRVAWRHKVVVVLQTFPPQRFSGKERSIDPVIRSVANSLQVPLSDTSSELGKTWNGRALEPFYGTPGLPLRDDHLNREGNGLVAAILLEDLRRFGLLPP